MSQSSLLEAPGGGAEIRPTPTTRPMREPEALSPRMRVRRAVTLLMLTALVPGSAQLAAGSRRIGRIALRTWLALIGVGAVLLALALLDRGALVALLTSQVVLTFAALLCYAVAICLPLLLFDAWRLTRPRLMPTRPRRWVAALAVVLAVVTCLVPVMAGRRVWAAGDLIGSVFGSGKAAAAHDGRYTVLLLGGDAGGDRVGLRPDSVTLASIDASTGRTVLFSLPRNLQNVPFPQGSLAAEAMPQGWSCGDQCLLNAIYTWGTANRQYFPGAPDPGAEAMKQAVGAVLGLPVDYYVIVDLAGFEKIIDAMGGIDVDVLARVPIGGETSRISGWIEPGEQHLDGYHALWYARSRARTSDYDRMTRQRCVMSAMVSQLDPGTLLARFQDIAAAGKSVVKTDLPAGELGKFVSLALKAKSQKISSVQFVPPLIKPVHPDYAVIRDKVKEAVAATDRPAVAHASAKPTATATPSASASSPGGGDGTPTDVRAVCSAG